jgi:predicted nucleic acid-binding Zn ribbon protein
MVSMFQTYQFTCPECSAEITVDAAVRDELLTAGCVLCAGAVSQSHFTRTSSSDPSR